VYKHSQNFRLCLLLLTACLFSLDVHSNEDKRANELFETFFEQWLSRSPLMQTDLGIKTDYDKWDDLSEQHATANHRLYQRQLQQLQDIDTQKLSAPVALSHTLMKQQLTKDIENYRWRHHDYPVNQMFGWHTTVPSILINAHLIESVADADAYIARLLGVKRLMQQVCDGLELRAKKGIIAPAFVFPLVIDDSLNVIKGHPFETAKAPANSSPSQPEPIKDSPLMADFRAKITALSADQKTQERLIRQAEHALVSSVQPGYIQLSNTLKKLQKKADVHLGAWKFPEGEAFYNAALRDTTTTHLSAEQIHNLGLQEVARIHNEMQSIMTQVKFKGDLPTFFKHLQQSDEFFYESDAKGRAAYLQKTQSAIAEIESRLDELFLTKPKAELIVKQVEAYREKSAGRAFYQSPPPDGSRPGIYYANLYNMREMPKYQLEALVYHEALPGHHLQLSIATELGDLPRFRKHAFYTAYIEGWGLYAELLPKEIGLYQDPYSDFGRLSMELWRACRLVVDTGIHAKRWTEAQAIQYLLDNTPSEEREIRRAVQRYSVMPSQATAYKIGMLKILELRDAYKAKTGEHYDIREFHHKILHLGAVPLNILEQQLQL